jgi:hypothetical protein
MTEWLLNVRKRIAVQDPDGTETQSTFDRLLRDYFGPQVVQAAISMPDSHTPLLRGIASSGIQGEGQQR